MALDAVGPEGWGSAPGGAGPARSLFACGPAVVFAGGIEALRDAQLWLGGFAGGAIDDALLVGYIGYDLGRVFECVPQSNAVEPPDDVPAVWLAGFRAAYRYSGRGSGAVSGSEPGAVQRLADRIEAAGEQPPKPRRVQLPPPRVRTSDARFLESVRAIQDYIRAGDVYQVNLARRLDLAPVAPPSLPDLYAELTRSCGAPFSSYLATGDAVILSNTPERFLRVAGRRVETCPIKGTRPRGRSPAEDRLLAKELLRSEKDRAEHLMIVDLERNDLGRVCEIGSVCVPRLGALRSYATVHHLVSSVQGELRDPQDWVGLLAATFPGGSITGAPKVRALEIIEQLEPVRRGVYTGAIGCFDAAGGIDLSLAIRTAVARDDALSLYVGGGIVADSDPAAELAETRDKSQAFAQFWTGA